MNEGNYKAERLTNVLMLAGFFAFSNTQAQNSYPIVDTDVNDFYNNSSIISTPNVGDPFYGQDASYIGFQPNYLNNGDGTVTDSVTGLMWQKNMGAKITFSEALAKADTMSLGGYTDWRIPTIKELYSLALFTGRCLGDQAMYKFIDTVYFDQPIGNVLLGEREIDGQTWSQTQCVDLLVIGDTAIYGYNFVDGRLKGYPKYDPQTGMANKMYFRMVRGNPNYGVNNFSNNSNGTITDQATGLMWQQADDGNTYDWEDALAYAENLTLGGYADWRLPNAKELQSIVDYTRSPNTTNSPAIDAMFTCTSITDPYGNPGQYGHYWSGSPLQDGPQPYSDAVYFCFGKAQGQMEMPPNSGNFQLLNVHGAGAQRNDPKAGNPSDFPDYFGPQGDVRYVYNFVRCVRDVNSATSIGEASLKNSINLYPNPSTIRFTVSLSPEIQLNKLELFDARGALIKSINNLHDDEVTVDVSNLQSGIYILEIYSSQGKAARKLVVK